MLLVILWKIKDYAIIEPQQGINLFNSSFILPASVFKPRGNLQAHVCHHSYVSFGCADIPLMV